MFKGSSELTRETGITDTGPSCCHDSIDLLLEGVISCGMFEIVVDR